MNKFITSILASILLSPCAAPGHPPAAPRKITIAATRPAAVNVKVVAVGISQARLDAAEKALPNNRSLAPLLRGANYRLLYTEPAEGDDRAPGAAPDRFRSVFYDYTRQRAIVVEGSLGEPAAATARVVKNWQPYVNDNKFKKPSRS